MVDLMKYLLSYASNPTLSSETNNLQSKEFVESCVWNLLNELAEVNSRVQVSDISAPEQSQFSSRSGLTPSPLGQNILMKRGDWLCPKCNFMNFARNVKCLECEQPRPKRLLTGREWECTQCDFYNHGRNLVCLRCNCKRPGEASLGTVISRLGLRSKSMTLGENVQLSEKSVTKEEVQDKEKEEAEKSELHDVTDLTSAISDENFPEIMPMRKGENRFVVDKNKNRSLTSPMYKRQMAMEQARNTKYVPFVPFPPDYFAKKDKQQPEDSRPSTKSAGQVSSISASPNNFPEKLDDTKQAAADLNHLQRLENRQTSSGNWSSHSSGDCAAPSSGNPTESSFSSQTASRRSWSSGYSGNKSSQNMSGRSTQPPENRNFRSGWTGKSLEGSAVEEPDPLDMSEEAKAQRWFRRVAQIKDITELSQIPDEDFPSIMPMRKGVNRFVVSKRKTPLERRLASPRYRRNLPIVSSDSVKKENNNS